MSQTERPFGQIDYSVLDEPEILTRIFHPSRRWNETPDGAQDHMIPVDIGISISARYYPVEQGPVILYFHGNGELACDYDEIADIYTRLGMGFFVADYRGYGRSDGTPSFSTFPPDSDKIFDYFLQTVREKDPDAKVFVMGRSLGCVTALEIASRHQDQICGIIIDSGVGNIAENTDIFGISPNRFAKLSQEINSQVETVDVPCLMIHGGHDTLVSLKVALNLRHHLKPEKSQLVIIPGAGHNDIMFVDPVHYFGHIADFVGARPDIDY